MDRSSIQGIQLFFSVNILKTYKLYIRPWLLFRRSGVQLLIQRPSMHTQICSGFCGSLQENAVKILTPSDFKHHEEAFFSSFSAYFPYMEKIKECLCHDDAPCVSTLINFLMDEPIFMKLGMCIMAPEPN
jgi:hypothetical protein